MSAIEDPAALIIEAWCTPTLVSPAGRPCSVLQLEERQAAGPVDIGDPYLEDEQWDMEAMVLATIAGQLEDEEEDSRKALSSGTGDRDTCTSVHMRASMHQHVVRRESKLTK